MDLTAITYAVSGKRITLEVVLYHGHLSASSFREP